MKHIFHASYEIFVVLKKIIQQIAYIVLYIILSDEYKVLISYKMPLFRVKFSETTSDARVYFLHFFQSEGTRSEDTNQTIF